MASFSLVLCLSAFLSFSLSLSLPLPPLPPPSHLCVEYLCRPPILGIHSLHPRFTWVSNLNNGIGVTANLVVSIPDEGGRVVWNTSIALSPSVSPFVAYSGQLLTSSQYYEWRVREREGEGEWTDSATSAFVTAILPNSEWSAEWISSSSAARASFSFPPSPTPTHPHRLSRPRKQKTG